MDENLKPLRRGVEIGVAGITKYQALANRVQIGTEVRLHHDMTNHFDEHAVAITVDGERLGYVPARGKVNQRLLLGHRGGVWRGEISDWYKRNGTVGVQVRITDLIGHNSVEFGSQHTGLREVSADADDVTIAPHPGEATPSREVPTSSEPVTVTQRRAKSKGSGRDLGEVVEFTGERLRVQTATGRIASYPAAVVTIVEVVLGAEDAHALPDHPAQEQSVA